jgi:hypothetical protein
MVERPIKKSERLAKAATEGESVAAQPSERRENRSDRRKGDKGKGKGGREETARPPANPALMRGPKPEKPKPEPEVPPEPEVTAETEAEETATEATEAIADAPTETQATEEPVAVTEA